MEKAKACPSDELKKQDEEEEEKDEGEEEEEEKSSKSMIDADDLMKSLDVLEAASNGIGGEQDRRAELAEGLSNGTLSKSEQAELVELLGGASEPEPEGEAATDDEVAKSFAEQFANDEQLSQDYDVSSFIERQSQLMASGLDELAGRLEKSHTEQFAFNRALAKSFKAIGEVVAHQQALIKSLAGQNVELGQRVQQVENTPLPRKARTGATPLRKSAKGEVGGDDGLSRDEIMDGLNRLMLKSKDNNWVAPCGEPIDRAVALYEQTGQITRGMVGDVINELGKNVQLQ